MEQNPQIKIILYIVLGLLVANLLFSLFGMNKNLKDTLKILNETEVKLKTVNEQLNSAESKVTDIQNNLKEYSAYIHDIQGRVESMDLERKLNEEKYRHVRDSIKARIVEIKKDIDLTGEDLPPIGESSLGK